MSNSDVSHASDCIFYDSELKELQKSFKSAYEILRQISKRAERRDTIQMSKSLFDYVERKRTRTSDPAQFFNFVFDDYRCCIYRYRKLYRILCLGFECPFFARPIPEWTGAGNMYGSWLDISDDLVTYFGDTVVYLITKIIIPFIGRDGVIF